MTAPQPETLSVPAGQVTVTTYGYITQQTVTSLMEARSFCEKQGAVNIAWTMQPGSLVDRARNAACREMLRDPAKQWLLFIDGDSTCTPDAVLHIVHTAFAEAPYAHVVGGYVPLRGDIALPTIDTGTGTWESWFPGSGIIEVIRTGGAFLLIKRAVLENLAEPWFRTRVPVRPLDFLAEVDNFARIKFDGRNPMRNLPGEPWERLEKCAREDPSAAPEQANYSEVGEDSNFCDRVRAAGFRIVVNTDIACGHVDHRVLTGADHRKAIDERDKTQRLLCGILS